MKSMLTAIPVLALSFAALHGCYSDRLTGNYSNTAELELDNGAILEENGNDAATEAANEERLRAIAAHDEEPVYKMNAGDSIEIRVYGHEDLGIITRIGPDGTVGIAFMGQVKLSGLTIAEGADKIRDGLSPYVKNPVVSVTVREVVSETATIAGACKSPGVYGISNNTRLADIYATAGASAERLFNGVSEYVADLDNSIFVRNGEILPVNFRKAVDKGDPLHNIRVRKGDYIHIAERMNSTVTVCGDVKTPHKRMFEHGMGLIETLTSAGWLADTHWSHVIIIRDGLVNPKLYKVDVDGIMAGKHKNVPLKPGDIIYVPKDNISEYNVFVRKLLPTAQLINLLTSRVSAFTSN